MHFSLSLSLFVTYALRIVGVGLEVLCVSVRAFFPPVDCFCARLFPQTR